MEEFVLVSKLLVALCAIFKCNLARNGDILTSSTSLPDYWSTSNCTELGRFPNRNDKTCQTYLMCVEEFDVPVIIKCPLGTAYNEEMKICISRPFLCPNICSGVGLFPNRTLGCVDYFLCEYNLEKQLGIFSKTCPQGEWFCEEAKKCLPGPDDACIAPNSTMTTEFENTEETSELISTSSIFVTTFSDIHTEEPVSTTTESTTSSFIVTETMTSESQTLSTNFEDQESTTFTPITSIRPDDQENDEFVCNTTGRFPLKNSCNQYVLCVQNVYGDWVLSIRHCGNGAVFSPTTRRCVLV